MIMFKFLFTLIVISSNTSFILSNPIYNDNTTLEFNDENDCDSIAINIDNTNSKSTHLNTTSFNEHETTVINDPSGTNIDKYSQYNNNSNDDDVSGGGGGSSVDCRRPCGNACCEPGKVCTADGVCGETCGLGNYCFEGETCCRNSICCPDIESVVCRLYGPVLQCAISECGVDNDPNLPCDTGNGFGECLGDDCCLKEAVCKSIDDDSLMCCDGSDQYCSDNGYCESKCGTEELYCDYPNTQCCVGSNGLGSCCLDNFHCCPYASGDDLPICCPEGWECCGSGCIDPTISVCCGGVECQFEGYCCNVRNECIQRPEDSDCDSSWDCCNDESYCIDFKCCPNDKRCGSNVDISNGVTTQAIKCCESDEYCCNSDEAKCCPIDD